MINNLDIIHGPDLYIRRRFGDWTTLMLKWSIIWILFMVLIFTSEDVSETALLSCYNDQ
jgi:hypothetical protein